MKLWSCQCWICSSRLWYLRSKFWHYNRDWIAQVLDLLDRVKQDRERKESGDTSSSQLITPVDDDDDFDIDLEDKDETPITPKPKKKTKTKAPPKAAARKVEADDNDFDWDDEEFRDLDFNDDEKIIFIK
jgi:hypothetical protein